MCESSRSSVLVGCNSHAGDGTAVLEELLDGPLLGSEAKVANEKSVGLTGVSTSSALGLVSTSSLAGELNPDGSAVKLLLVGLVEGLSSLGVLAVLDEGLALVVQELALGQLTEFAEELVEGVLGGVEAHALDEELGLAVVLVGNGGGVLSLSLGLGLHLLVVGSGR